MGPTAAAISYAMYKLPSAPKLVYHRMITKFSMGHVSSTCPLSGSAGLVGTLLIPCQCYVTGHIGIVYKKVTVGFVLGMKCQA